MCVVLLVDLCKIDAVPTPTPQINWMEVMYNSAFLFSGFSYVTGVIMSTSRYVCRSSISGMKSVVKMCNYF